MRHSLFRSLAATLLAVASAACSTDTSLAPSLAATDFRPQLQVVDPAVLVDVLQRTSPLLANVSVTATIGRSGGFIRIREAGLTIDVPANAFASSQITFKITALAGTNVAYEFEPHGLVFKRPLTVTQDLQGTSAFKLASTSTLEGAYFADLTTLRTGSARVNEFRKTAVDLTKAKLHFPVDHFSGYLVSTGRR